MKPPIEYRPKPNHGKARKATFATKGADTPVTLVGTDQYGKRVTETVIVSKEAAKAIRAALPAAPLEDPAAELARRRRMKADQMKRFRANRKAKKEKRAKKAAKAK